MTCLLNIQTGDELEEVKLEPVSKEALIEYANASGDHNPIHQDEEQAKRLGLPGVIAHGMWTMGNLSKLFTPYYEDGFIKDFTIRFRDMVFLNDSIRLKAKLETKLENELHFIVSAINQKEQEVLKGTVVYYLYETS